MGDDPIHDDIGKSKGMYKYNQRTIMSLEPESISKSTSIFDNYDNFEVYSMDITPNSKDIILGGSNGLNKVYSLNSGEHLATISNTDISSTPMPCTAITTKPSKHSYNNPIVINTTADGYIRQYTYASSNADDVHAGTYLYEHSEVDNQIFTCSYSGNYSHFSTAGRDMKIRVYDDETKQVVTTLNNNNNDGNVSSNIGHSNRIFSLKYFNNDDNILVTGGWDNVLNIWDSRCGDDSQRVSSILSALNNNNSMNTSNIQNPTSINKLLNVNTNLSSRYNTNHDIYSHLYHSTSTNFNTNINTTPPTSNITDIAPITSNANKAKLNQSLLQSLYGPHLCSNNTIDVYHNNHYILAGSCRSDNACQMIDIRTNSVIFTYEINTDNNDYYTDCTLEQPTAYGASSQSRGMRPMLVYSCMFSPCNRFIAVGGSGNAHVKILDVDQGKCVDQIFVDNEGVYALKWSPNGRFIAAAGKSPHVVVVQDVCDVYE